MVPTRELNITMAGMSVEREDGIDVNDMNDLSDEELQEAFAAGLLKPGLNIPFEKRECKNNVNGLKSKLNEIKLNFNWIEKLDMVNLPAPLAPEIYNEINTDKVVKLKHHFKFNGAFQGKACMDDFKREMLFHRQGQSAVLEGMPQLKKLGLFTKRPDDYFAEMAKSDQHMQKVRQNLAIRQKAVCQSQKAQELRKQKKLGKQAQIEAKLKLANEKREMLNKVRKYKKGLTRDLSFLENKNENKGALFKARLLKKRTLKNDKFGFGGKKKGLKRNTKESASYLGSQSKKGKNPRSKINKRMGKSKRIKKRLKK